MNAQRLLMELFAKKHKAVSIGMRSGVLDGLALVGMPVIYMDHYMDQHPERPEKLAGKAGKPRATAEKWSDADEVGKDVKGKVPHYKRFALKFDFHKGEVKKIVKACKNTSTLLTKKKIQLEEKSPEVSEAFDAVKSIVLNPSSRWEDMVCYCTSWDKIKAVQKNVTFPDGKQVQISHIQLSADELMLFAEKGESLLSADFMLLEEEKPKLKALIDYLITRAPNAGGEEAPLASQET